MNTILDYTTDRMDRVAAESVCRLLEDHGYTSIQLVQDWKFGRSVNNCTVRAIDPGYATRTAGSMAVALALVSIPTPVVIEPYVRKVA